MVYRVCLEQSKAASKCQNSRKWVVYPHLVDNMIDNQKYTFSDQVLLRTPFYSFRDYDPANLEAVLSREDFRNALWLASMDFYSLLEKKEFDYGRLQARERYTLQKYYNRMSFRPTPFGSFAAFTLTQWKAAQELRLERAPDCLLHLLPSLEWKAAGLSQEMISCDLPIAANPTLYQVGREWRFTRSVPEPSGKLVFSLQAIDANPTNNRLISLTSGKPVQRIVLIKDLLRRSGCSHAEAAAYLDFLLQDQVLFSGTSVSLIEPDFEKETALDSGNTVKRAVTSIAAVGDLSRFNAPRQPFYAALERPVYRGGLDAELQKQLANVVTMLSKVVPQFANREQQDFIKAFKAKFEGRKVPLLQALDPDTGISYDQLHRDSHVAGGLEKLRFPEKGKARTEIGWSPVHRLFLNSWMGNSKRSSYDPVIITDEELLQLEPADAELQLPSTLALLFTRTTAGLVLETAGGASATALAGRFSALSAEAEALCRELAEAESAASPGVIFAEIHQRSHQHFDNINRRSRVYKHIIPINVFPDPKGGEMLYLDDLLVSVVQDTLILESVSLGKRVIPRLPTAFNYHHNELAMFRFLCDMQFQGLRADLSLNPERLFPGMAYYPRIIYRDCILSPARWHLRKDELSQLCTRPGSLGKLHLFRQERGMPRHVSLGLNDQQLVFDLANDGEALFFLENLQEETNSAVIREYLFPENTVWAEKKPLAAQFMTFLKRNQQVYHALPAQLPIAGAAVERTFLPGSEWLYVKIYCTPQSADRVLLEVIRPLLRKNRAVIRCWFFIRYQDPEPHLRVRIRSHNRDASFLLEELRRRLSGPKHRELIREYRSDTYTREIERYSEELIEAVEVFFSAGSTVVLEQKATQLTVPMQQTIDEAFWMTWEMCRIFLNNFSEVLDFLARHKERFLQEFGSAELRIDLDQQYRNLAGSLRLTLEAPPARPRTSGATLKMMKILGTLSVRTVSWLANSRTGLLADLVHMQLNRMFAWRQREHEAMVYYVLHKYAVSLAARRKPN
jgi:thiopeptide-type bacteriocin biosynthesis protein